MLLKLRSQQFTETELPKPPDSTKATSLDKILVAFLKKLSTEQSWQNFLTAA